MEFKKENAVEYKLIDGIKYYEKGTYPSGTIFNGECSFPAYTEFGDWSTFTGKCSFGDHCTFGANCTFAPKTTFSDYSFFRNGSRFCSETCFGDDCQFNGSFGFGSRQSFGKDCLFNGNSSFGKNCRFERKIAKDSSPVFTASPVGFHRLIFTAYNLKEGIFISYSALKMLKIEEFRLSFQNEEKFFNRPEDFKQTYMEVIALADFVETIWSK